VFLCTGWAFAVLYGSRSLMRLREGSGVLRCLKLFGHRIFSPARDKTTRTPTSLAQRSPPPPQLQLPPPPLLSHLFFIVGHCWLSYTRSIRDLIEVRPSHCIDDARLSKSGPSSNDQGMPKRSFTDYVQGSVCRPTKQTCRGITNI
jgi:hypothetical protein